MDAISSSSSLFPAFCLRHRTMINSSSPSSSLFHDSSVHNCNQQSKLNNPPPNYKPNSVSTNLLISDGIKKLSLVSVAIEAFFVATTKTTPLPQPGPKTTPTTKTPPPSSRAIASRRRVAESSFANIILNAFDYVINNFIDPPLRPSVDPKHVLSNNFSPVDELPPTDCPVIEGKLPSCLKGAYIRNGPNPQYLPRGSYHLFDGDGMLHSLLISEGCATLCSRYVKTYKYLTENQAGSSLFPNVFSGFNGLPAMVTRSALAAARVLSGQCDPSNGIGLANTSLAFFGNKLFALGESDLPYTIRLTPDGDIETIGRHDFDGKLWMNMTAHPKIDADTGEVFAFRYSPIPPFVTFYRFDANGSKQEPEVDCYTSKVILFWGLLQKCQFGVVPAFIHDFTITKKYAISADIQIGMKMNPIELIMGSGPVGVDPEKVPRIGVLPRYAKDETGIRWFDVLGLNNVHAINAWDEEDAIVMIAPNILSVEHALERMELVHASVEKIRINLKTGTVSRIPISARNLEFGVINPAFMGKKNRYGYAGVGNPLPKISGVVKLDWSDEETADHNECIVASRMFGSGCFGGEPFFVGKEEGSEEEDDGYVVTYVHDENVDDSQFLVMDAKSPNLDVVAAVKLPRRVPYGLHGLFVKESDLFNNKP